MSRLIMLFKTPSTHPLLICQVSVPDRGSSSRPSVAFYLGRDVNIHIPGVPFVPAGSELPAKCLNFPFWKSTAVMRKISRIWEPFSYFWFPSCWKMCSFPTSVGQPEAWRWPGAGATGIQRGERAAVPMVSSSLLSAQKHAFFSLPKCSFWSVIHDSFTVTAKSKENTLIIFATS